MSAQAKPALLLIDLQPDFFPGGSLAVPDGDAVLAPCNALRAAFPWPGGVYLTQDWHPADHISFASNHPGKAVFSTAQLPAPTGEQVRRPARQALRCARARARAVAQQPRPSPSPHPQTLWPDHCVQGSAGAAIHAGVARGAGDVVVQKGAARLVDSYSGFGDAQGGAHERTALEGHLRAAGATAVVVAGLALDWCVAFTCKDAKRLGFDTYLVLEGCRGINADNKVEKELAQLRGLGVHIVDTAAQLPAALFPQRA
jgi:nicotinamidase/pyrazinamidase